MKGQKDLRTMKKWWTGLKIKEIIVTQNGSDRLLWNIRPVLGLFNSRNKFDRDTIFSAEKVINIEFNTNRD